MKNKTITRCKTTKKMQNSADAQNNTKYAKQLPQGKKLQDVSCHKMTKDRHTQATKRNKTTQKMQDK